MKNIREMEVVLQAIDNVVRGFVDDMDQKQADVFGHMLEETIEPFTEKGNVKIPDTEKESGMMASAEIRTHANMVNALIDNFYNISMITEEVAMFCRIVKKHLEETSPYGKSDTEMQADTLADIIADRVIEKLHGTEERADEANSL